MLEGLKHCTICPWKCGADRSSESLGRCRCSDKIKIALASLHHFEEPCISGDNGSGTIFFTGCNLNCIYCQNHEISQDLKGKEISIGHLADIMLKQQNERKAENINLVTPTMYVYHIIEAIKIAKKKGLTIPIVYNTNGFENVETLQLLEGYIDVYLPDMKYSEDTLARKYSGVENYSTVAKEALKEMYRQVGKPVFDQKGMIKKGVIIRHLVLPNHIENSKKVLQWIHEEFGNQVLTSIMAQYFPTHLAKAQDKLNRKLTPKEYQEMERYVLDLGIEQGYMQELGEHEEEYVPNFDLSE